MEVSEKQNTIMILWTTYIIHNGIIFIFFQLLITPESKKKNINFYHLSIQYMASQLYVKQTVNIKWLTPCAKDLVIANRSLYGL